MGALGVDRARDALYPALDALGLEALAAGEDADEGAALRVRPTFSGERHAPELRGTITGISADNMGLGQLCAALARGIVENLRGMVPEEALRGKRRVVASGNAIRRSRLLQAVIQRVFALPLEVCEYPEEAAVGASLIAGCGCEGDERQSL